MNVTRVITQQMRNLWTKQKPDFGRYALVKPGRVTPPKKVPDHIPKPPYYASGVPTPVPERSEVKNAEQIGGMRESCKLAANVLKMVGETIKVGMTTDEIDCLVHRLSIENGAYPSTLNYSNFPKSVCTSVNNVACHGIPDDRPLEDGDIINVDITVYLNGYHGDCSKTFLVGNVDDAGRKLVEVTEMCLNKAIAICKPGQRFSSIGSLIEQTAHSYGFFVIPCFLGHGIGSYFHGPPDIYHFANYEHNPMWSGMTFTIEPVLTQGCQEVVILEDNWTAVTEDDARTSQFEHTVLITETGCEVLTLPS